MAAEDLYRVLPLPGLDPESLGLPPMPPAPLPPQPSQGLAQSGNQKALTLASIAALLTGGPRMVGLGQGVMHGQQLLEQERMRRDQEQRQQFQQEEQAYRVQQQAYQQAAAARQKVLSDAVTGIRQQVQTKAIKSKADYDATVEQMAALLQNQFGMRVSPNYFRQAAAYVEPTSQERASQALDDVLKSPLTAEAMKADPSKVLLGKVQFDANGDGIPEQYALTELAALAGRPMIADEQGNPIIPEKADGKVGTPFQELLRSDLDQFRTENRRDPNPKEKSVIVQKAMEKSKEKPASDGMLSAIAQETAGLRRDLLQAQVEAAKQKNAPPDTSYADERSQRIADSVDALIGKVSNWTAGPGSVLGGLPATEARNFKAELDTLKANIAFGELAEMRAASKTGGALGQVSERELTLLSSALGALDTGQSPANLKAQLQKISASLRRWDAAKRGGSSGGDHQVGEIKTFPNGKRGRWDGTGWELIQ